MDSGFDPTIGALNTVLNLRTMNENLINSNIANADTPGYKAKAMEFEGALRSALNVGNELKPTTTRAATSPQSATDPVEPRFTTIRTVSSLWTETPWIAAPR